MEFSLTADPDKACDIPEKAVLQGIRRFLRVSLLGFTTAPTAIPIGIHARYPRAGIHVSEGRRNRISLVRYQGLQSGSLGKRRYCDKIAGKDTSKVSTEKASFHGGSCHGNRPVDGPRRLVDKWGDRSG